MLWYGYIYYLLYLTLILVLIIFSFRLIFLNTFYNNNLASLIAQYTLSFFIFLSFLSLSTNYIIFDFYSMFNVILLKTPNKVIYFETLPNSYFLNSYSLSLNLASIYCFPFIYIFILITIISILFCLAYNTNEVLSFIFYSLIILTSGYVLFFTDSLILFFLSYEMLLVPSFFILYNFAKTRRCVEAAYLMFF